MHRTRNWMAVPMLMMFAAASYGQHLTSSRGVGMGAFTAAAGDISAIDWNPAGLIFLRDWELMTSAFLVPQAAGRYSAFQTVGLGKRFAADHAASFRISPGMQIEFIVPSLFTLEDSTATFTTEFDRKISYSEQFSFGYAFRVGENAAIGFSAHFLEEKLTDAQYSIDSNSVIRSSVVEQKGASWSLDWGVGWMPTGDWRLGLVAKNLFHVTETSLNEDSRQYSLEIPKTLRLGVSYGGVRNTTLALDGDLERRLRVGLDWKGIQDLSLQAGTYIDASSTPSIDALAAGISGSYGNLDVGVSYLAFLDQENRRGSANRSTFENARIEGIEYNQFTGDRISMSASVRLGRTRESLARIEYVEMLSEVYPASHTVYAFRPIGKARVRNTSTTPIDAKVSFYLNDLMDGPTVTRPYRLAPDEVAEIPFFAVFNGLVRSISSLVIQDGEVFVNASPRDEYDDRYQTRVLVRGRNDWNGDVTLLKYFITPDDPQIVAFTRQALSRKKDHLDSLPDVTQQLERAKILYDEFAGLLTYVGDPKKSQDFVQYPGETLALRSGDCDDMSVLYASLLASVGIAAAFIDVIPPNDPGSSHIYLMFDTGVAPDQAFRVSENPKRYIIRRNEQGKETVWIPIETTVMRSGFEEAWARGAQEYFNDTEVKLGVVKGWVRVIDLDVAN